MSGLWSYGGAASSTTVPSQSGGGVETELTEAMRVLPTAIDHFGAFHFSTEAEKLKCGVTEVLSEELNFGRNLVNTEGGVPANAADSGLEERLLHLLHVSGEIPSTNGMETSRQNEIEPAFLAAPSPLTPNKDTLTEVLSFKDFNRCGVQEKKVDEVVSLQLLSCSNTSSAAAFPLLSTEPRLEIPEVRSVAKEWACTGASSTSDETKQKGEESHSVCSSLSTSTMHIDPTLHLAEDVKTSPKSVPRERTCSLASSTKVVAATANRAPAAAPPRSCKQKQQQQPQETDKKRVALITSTSSSLSRMERRAMERQQARERLAAQQAERARRDAAAKLVREEAVESTRVPFSRYQRRRKAATPEKSSGSSISTCQHGSRVARLACPHEPPAWLKKIWELVIAVQHTIAVESPPAEGLTCSQEVSVERHYAVLGGIAGDAYHCLSLLTKVTHRWRRAHTFYRAERKKGEGSTKPSALFCQRLACRHQKEEEARIVALEAYQEYQRCLSAHLLPLLQAECVARQALWGSEAAMRQRVEQLRRMTFANNFLHPLRYHFALWKVLQEQRMRDKDITNYGLRLALLAKKALSGDISS